MEDEPRTSDWALWLALLMAVAVGALGFLAQWLHWLPDRYGRTEAFFVGVTWFVGIGASVAGERTQKRWRAEGWSPATIGGFVVTGILSVVTFTLLATAVLWFFGRV